MKDVDGYLRNRARETIADMFRMIREYQRLCSFKNSDILKMMANIYRQTGGGKVGTQIYELARLVERDELLGRK